MENLSCSAKEYFPDAADPVVAAVDVTALGLSTTTVPAFALSAAVTPLAPATAVAAGPELSPATLDPAAILTPVIVVLLDRELAHQVTGEAAVPASAAAADPHQRHPVCLTLTYHFQPVSLHLCLSLSE